MKGELPKIYSILLIFNSKIKCLPPPPPPPSTRTLTQP